MGLGGLAVHESSSSASLLGMPPRFCRVLGVGHAFAGEICGGSGADHTPAVLVVLQLEYILELETEAWLERRLQTQIWKLDMAKSIHHARVLIKQRHIAVAKQLVTVPSFLVRTSQEGHIGLADSSPLAPNAQRMGRVKRMKAKAAKIQADAKG